MKSGLDIEVLWASPSEQILRPLSVEPGCTAAEAIELAGLTAVWQTEAGGPRPLSCFGRLIAPEQRLSAGDRVEILRPLMADAKDQRHQRVKAARLRRARAR